LPFFKVIFTFMVVTLLSDLIYNVRKFLPPVKAKCQGQRSKWGKIGAKMGQNLVKTSLLWTHQLVCVPHGIK